MTFDSISTFERGIALFLVVVFCFVMYRSFVSLRRSPTLGWYRGFHSSPLFQLVMWLGAIPFLLPALYLLRRRKTLLKSAPFVGNIKSRVLHRRGCEYEVRIYSDLLRYPFPSERGAIESGYRRCRWCWPSR